MVYIPFFCKIDLEKTLLVFDRAPMHDNYQTINYLLRKKLILFYSKKYDFRITAIRLTN